MPIESKKIVIIGIGHPMRGDDALGPTVIDQLTNKIPAHIKTHKCLGDMAELLDIFEAYTYVYIIDAIQTHENKPGTPYRFSNDNLDLIAPQCRTSTHAFDLGQTIEMARNLDSLPEKLILFGIEAQNFKQGDPLSFCLKVAIPKLIQDIITEIKTIDKGNTSCMN